MRAQGLRAGSSASLHGRTPIPPKRRERKGRFGATGLHHTWRTRGLPSLEERGRRDAEALREAEQVLRAEGFRAVLDEADLQLAVFVQEDPDDRQSRLAEVRSYFLGGDLVPRDLGVELDATKAVYEDDRIPWARAWYEGPEVDEAVQAGGSISPHGHGQFAGTDLHAHFLPLPACIEKIYSVGGFADAQQNRFPSLSVLEISVPGVRV